MKREREPQNALLRYNFNLLAALFIFNYEFILASWQAEQGGTDEQQRRVNTLLDWKIMMEKDSQGYYYPDYLFPPLLIYNIHLILSCYFCFILYILYHSQL